LALPASALERVLAGLREAIPHDDHLLAAASAIFEACSTNL
jgi:hypothetical protein